jgi:type IV pilus assembly protein PilY1
MKIYWRYWCIKLLCLVMAFPVPAVADDTDIFTSSAAVTGMTPNVLIILDNSANWSASFDGATKFSSEMATLSAVIGNLNTNVNVGFMAFGETGPGTSAPVSTYMRYAVRNMTGGNRSALRNMITGLNINGDKSNNAPYGFALFEAFKYFGGGGTAQAPQNAQNFGPVAFGGFGQPKRDYSGNSAANTAGALPGNAFSGALSNVYLSPISDACQKNYVIFISNGMPQAGADNGNPSASTLLSRVGGAAAINTIPLPNSTAQGNIGDEYARFLYQTDVSSLAGKQNIVTYTVNVYDPAHMTGNDTSNIVLLESMANQGHGRYFAATNTVALSNALQAIFNEVQSVNTVFASVTLPVSVNVRGTNLNQIYLGGFRPDPDASPRWFGNMKEYQLSLNSSTGKVFLSDMNGMAAESPSTGFVVDDAISYWTSASTFWSFAPSGNPPSASDSPDGPVVEKGGVAQRIRGLYPNPDSTLVQTRKIYTCNGACPAGANVPLASYPFNTTNVSPSAAANITAFGASNAAEVTAIIDWVRGKDNAVDENLDGSFSDVRASVHGDVLHSRPAVVNYNRNADNNDVVIFYGSNDGLFRAVKGGQNATDGYEKWAFVPTEFFPKLKRLRDNLPAISAANPRPYFADGSVGVYQLDVNNDGKLVAADGDKVYLYISMRRGGRMLYALDVTDPDQPKFMWKRDNTSPGYGELGQSWSEPKVRKIHASANPVLIFGGGYDPAVDDLDPIPVGTTNTVGRGIFVVDGLTGNVIWQAGSVAPATLAAGEVFQPVPAMTYAIPSDIAILDRNSDGYADRLYVGDMGGNVWRADINDPSPANWTVNKFASLGYAASSTVDSRRKFLFSPDVVYSRDANGPYDSVLIGSGDREHPFNGFGDSANPLVNAVTNRYYMLKDRNTGFAFSGTTITEAALFDNTNNIVSGSSDTALAAAKGWFITLATGEKVISSSITLGSATFFNTNRPTPPAPGVCGGNLGEAREYTVDFQTGGSIAPFNLAAGLPANARFLVHPGGGYQPSPVGAIVQLGGRLQQVLISGTSVLQPPASPVGARIRTFWNQK